MSAKPQTPDAKAKLLTAALHVIRAKGYAATSVDELCAEAGVTKGAFFHHFPTKDDLAVAAANHWTEYADALFGNAAFHAKKDPLDRFLAYIDFRKQILRGEIADFTCLVGTMVQEAYDNDKIRAACDASISYHAKTLEADIAEAIEKYGIKGSVSAKSLALHTQVVLQGAFVLAKAKDGRDIAVESIAHLRRYVELLFNRAPARRPSNA